MTYSACGILLRINNTFFTWFVPISWFNDEGLLCFKLLSLHSYLCHHFSHFAWEVGHIGSVFCLSIHSNIIIPIITTVIIITIIISTLVIIIIIFIVIIPIITAVIIGKLNLD